MLSLAHTHAPTRTRTHACTQAGMRALTRARLRSQTHRLTHCQLDALIHSTRCYGGVRDSLRMRRCSRRQRRRQIMHALLPRRALPCAQARQRSCESRRVGLLAVREQWHSVRSLLVLNAAAQAAAQWTTTPPNAHRQGEDGPVRPPMPMRQPCARPRTSPSLSGAPALVLLRRRAVRSLMQHAARVQRGRYAITTTGGTGLHAQSPGFRRAIAASHSTAVHRADLASTASTRSYAVSRRYVAAAYVVAY